MLDRDFSRIQKTSPEISTRAKNLAQMLIILPILWGIDWFSNQRIDWAYWPTAGWFGIFLLRTLRVRLASYLSTVGI